MKAPRITFHSGLAMLAGLVLSTTGAGAGQVVISNFDVDTDATAWSWESWSDPASVSFDTLNAGGGAPGSGSLRVVNDFPDRPAGYGQAVVTLALGSSIDAETLYTNVSFDIKLDPSSYPRVDGTNYGGIELIFRNGPNWDWNSLGNYELTADNTNWTHLNFKVQAPGDALHHLTIKLGQNNLTNTVIYNVDNLRWDEAPLNIPPPTMSIAKTKSGLNLLAASGGQYDRQGIATVGSSFGWIGSTAPMSYSMTIKEFPSAALYPGFSTHFYLVPGTPGNEEYPDWTEPNCILIDIHADTNGGGVCTFHYKTNAPNSNGINNQYFNSNPANGPVGQLGSVTSSNILGTWTVTLAQDTQITLTAPDGTSQNLLMPPEDAAQFAGDVKVYWGAVPGETANIGQTAILNGAEIKQGTTTVLTDDFSTSPLNTTLWVVAAASAAGVTLITSNEPYFVYWTTPASGFTLQVNGNLTQPNSWTDPALTDQLVGTKRRVLVPSSALPAASQGFFRLIKTL